MKVFLVEDSPLLRERLARQIGAIAGADLVGQAGTAEEALRGILAPQADVVVLDIQLDKGSGFDVLRALQKSAPHVAVFMLTNFASDSYRQAAERLGARGFFDKTTEFERLRDALAQRASAA